MSFRQMLFCVPKKIDVSSEQPLYSMETFNFPSVPTFIISLHAILFSKGNFFHGKKPLRATETLKFLLPVRRAARILSALPSVPRESLIPKESSPLFVVPSNRKLASERVTNRLTPAETVQTPGRSNEEARGARAFPGEGSRHN